MRQHVTPVPWGLPYSSAQQNVYIQQIHSLSFAGSCRCEAEGAARGGSGGGGAPQAALENALALPPGKLLGYEHIMDKACQLHVKVSLSLGASCDGKLCAAVPSSHL